MEIRRSTRDGCMVIAFTGSIDMLTVSRVRRALLKDLSEEPYALVCDLAGVDPLDPVCATVFSTVANHPASDWPTTSFLLCGAQPEVAEILGRLQVPHFLPLYADASTRRSTRSSPARRTCGTSCGWPRRRRRAAAARACTCARCCRYWRLALPDATVTDRAELLANELVTDAVVHARHRRAAAAGAARRPPAHRRAGRQPDGCCAWSPPTARPRAGAGCWLVEQLARAWGVNRHPDGGKVVWCVLDL